MAIDVSAVSYESGRQALQLAADGGSSIQEIASLLEQEAEDHLNSSSLDPYGDYGQVVGCDHHTALKIAASAGHMDVVVRLLEAGADPNAPVHEMGTSALEAAAAQGRLAVVQKLLEIGAHPNHRGKRSGASPLTAAAKAGHIEICEALVQNGADVSISVIGPSWIDNFSAIEAAAEISNTTLLDLFLGEVEDVSNKFNPDDLDVAIAEGQQEDSRRLLRTKEFLARAQISMDRALSAAAKSGNMLILQRLLDAGAEIIGPEKRFPEDCVNAIAAAASGGHLQVINKLLQTASDRNNLPAYAVTAAMQSAVDAGDITLIEPLLQNGADATRIDIRRAAGEGHLDVLTCILQSGALVETIQSTNDANYMLDSYTALQLAASHGHQAVVDLLLARGAEVNKPITFTKHIRPMPGATALQLAVTGEHLAITRRLIEAGAQVNEPRELTGLPYEADTPLQAAARTGNMTILELLMAAGAVADGGGGGRKKSALSVAAEVGNHDLVARLISIMSLDDTRSAAPQALLEAAENHHTDIVQQLLQLHPDVNKTTYEPHGLTLLQKAATNGDFEILEMLLSEGADVNLNPSGGWKQTALQSASERGDMAAVGLLLAAGAEVNVTGSTAPPLLLATRGGHIQVFERLLAAGADIHATAYQGQTILEAAEDSGVVEIQNFVRAALDSQPPPQIDQPPDHGTGPLCETCRLAPLGDLFWDSRQNLALHPSLTALRASAVAGCPFCCFLWKRLGLACISMRQPSPVELINDGDDDVMECSVVEPFPGDEGDPKFLSRKFPFFGGYRSMVFRYNRVPIMEDTSSPETYEQIHTWLDTCKNEHPQCRAPSGNASLPTRLIYLDKSRDSSLSNPVQANLHPRLVDTNGMEYSESKYIALSYRWPEDLPVAAKSSGDNVREQMRGLNASKLPQIFNDVFQVAASMGIDYVWIDSLCIVQDDPEDWSREAALMVQIYRYAEFTVAAAVPPTNPDLGLFRYGDPSDVPSVTLPGVRNPQDDGSGQDVVVMKPQKEAYKESPLVSRGWCFQEREISRRIVHYTETQVLWECRKLRASQSLPRGLREEDGGWVKRTFDGGLNDTNVDEAWYRAVEDYSARDLAVFTDKFPALSGLATAIHDYKPANCRYLAGLWEDNLLPGLLWSSRCRDGSNNTNTRYPEYVAPTWSWASVAGPVSYEALSFGYYPTDNNNTTDGDTHSADPMLKVLDICVQTSTNDPFGVVRHAVLTCTTAVVPGLLFDFDRVERPDGGQIGMMYFDVDQEKYDGQKRLEVVFCIHLGCKSDSHVYGPGLVVLPTGNRENEYRRIGMMEEMEWHCGFGSAEIKEITII